MRRYWRLPTLPGSAIRVAEKVLAAACNMGLLHRHKLGTPLLNYHSSENVVGLVTKVAEFGSFVLIEEPQILDKLSKDLSQFEIRSGPAELPRPTIEVNTIVVEERRQQEFAADLGLDELQ